MNVNYLKLENGLKICLIPNKEVESVTIHLKGLAGSNFEKENQIGVAHILEHFNTSRSDGNKITSNGGQIVGITSRDDVLFMVKLSKRYILDGLDFLSKVFGRENITITELNRLKSISLQEIERIRSNPEKFLGRVSCSTVFPYGRTSKLNIGEETYVNKLALENIYEFRDLHYYPNNFVLVVSGNFISSSILSYIKKLFGSFNQGTETKYVEHKYKEGLVVKNFIFKTLTQTLVKIDFKGFTTTDEKSYAGIIAAEIMDKLLNKLLKDSLGISYVAKCNSFSAGSYGIFSIYLSCDHSKLEILIKEVKRLVNNFQTIISSRTVDNAKTVVISNINFNLENTSSKAEFYSNLLLHGTKNQTFEYEMKELKNVSYLDIKTTSLELLNQDPKITVISSQLCDREIKRAWLETNKD